MGIIRSFPNKMNWAFKGAELQKTAKEQETKQKQWHRNKQRGLEDLGLPCFGNAVTAPLLGCEQGWTSGWRVWLGWYYRINTLSHHSLFFFVFPLALLAALSQDWGLGADSNKPAAYSLWACVLIQATGLDGVIMEWEWTLASLPMHVLDNATLNAIRQIVMDNNSGIHWCFVPN